MTIHRSIGWLVLVALLTGALPLGNGMAVAAAEKDEKQAADEKKEDQAADKDAKKADEEEDKIVTTTHSATINDEEIEYTVTAGKLAMKSDDGKTKAHIFFVAYT